MLVGALPNDTTPDQFFATLSRKADILASTWNGTAFGTDVLIMWGIMPTFAVRWDKTGGSGSIQISDPRLTAAIFVRGAGQTP